jgi:hypothetical protein
VRSPLLFAIPLAGILGLSLLHAYWAQRAMAVPVLRGQGSFNPTPLATWVVYGLLACVVLLVIVVLAASLAPALTGCHPSEAATTWLTADSSVQSS